MAKSFCLKYTNKEQDGPALVEKIADAILYEGHKLYPYARAETNVFKGHSVVMNQFHKPVVTDRSLSEREIFYVSGNSGEDR